MVTATTSLTALRTQNTACGRVRATRPIRFLIYAALAILLSGPPSFRLEGRSPAAVLSLTTALDTRALVQASLVAIATLIGCTLVVRRDVRRLLRERIQASKYARFLLAVLWIWIAFSAISVGVSRSPWNLSGDPST